MHSNLAPCITIMGHVLPVRSTIRETHTKEELRNIRRAAHMGDRVFLFLRTWIREGQSEMTIARKIEQLFKMFGVRELSFPPIVAFGSNAAEPHHMPTSRRLKKDELIKLDFGCVVQNKCSDMTRTVFYGKPTVRFQKLYQLVLAAQERATARVRAGVTAGAIDDAARSFLKKKGFGKQFVHGTGHGISEFVHELPLLRPKSQDKLTHGMVVTVEPGIYIKGWGGIRIEDMILVQKSHSEILTESPKNLLAIIIS